MNPKNFWTATGIVLLCGFLFLGNAVWLLIIPAGFYLIVNHKQIPDLIKALEREEYDTFFQLLWPPKVKPKQKNKSAKKHIASHFSRPSMKTSQIASILTPIILVLATVLIILDGFISVPAGHVGVLFDRGRGVLEKELDEGIHLKIPFWQHAILMNTRLQTYTMSAQLSEADLINNTKALQLQSLVNSSESAIRNYALNSGDSNNSIDALTKDGQTVTVDLTVQFQIDGDNASVIYRTIGLNYVDKVVRPAARSITREKVTGFTSKELYNESTRQKMEQEIEATMKDNFGRKNVILGDVLIRHIGFSQSYLNAIEEKQIAQQKIEKAEFEKQEAEIRKEKTIIEAEAEAESIKLKGEALSQSPEVIQLQFVEKMSPQIKWGIMPDSGVPLLDISQLAQ